MFSDLFIPDLSIAHNTLFKTNFNEKYIATSLKLLNKKDFELNEIEKVLMKNIKKQSMPNYLLEDRPFTHKKKSS